MALHLMQQSGKFQIDKLRTSINTHHDRVSMHGLKREILIQQAKAIGLPLSIIEIGESVYREYKSASKDSDASMGFWFCDLLPIESLIISLG